MKLYRYICGDYDKFGVANDDQDAYDRRAEVHPTFHYIPVKITEVEVDGYEITLKPLDENTAPRKGRKAQA